MNSRAVVQRVVRVERSFMYRHDLGPVPDAPAQLDDLDIRVYFLSCGLAQYELWVNAGVDIPSQIEASPYSGQHEAGTIVFWTTRHGIRVGSTAVATRIEGTVYAAALSRLLRETPPPGTAYEGLNETTPQFRRKGVFAWQQMFQLRFLREHGFSARFSLEPSEQEGPRRVQDRNGAVMIGELVHFEFPAFVRSRFRQSLWLRTRVRHRGAPAPRQG